MDKTRKISRVQHYNTKWKTNVAVYCRVSTSHDEQLVSLANQIEYYRAMVRKHLDWELIDIYADIQSGKNSSGRPEFQRMLEDCWNKKIDLIITKSISRFGRNTADTLDVINKLRSINIDIIFEVEKIQIFETNKAFLLSIIEAVAQAESESRSENIKWGIQHGLKSGTSKLFNRKCFGYGHDREGNIIINEYEANIVRKIFNLYLNGYSILTIIRQLEKEGIKSPTGKEHWAKRTVDTMLSNEKYIGNVIVGKTFSNDFPNNQRKINKGERQKYLVTDSHPPIITKDQFEQVQREKLRRSNIQNDGNTVRRKNTHYSMKKSNLKNNDE
ncbi:recombinase family protein [Petroclostridium sp. X23]|uniref:recombinase family protein n=1 Tax=Petroclostridium sp. X23 TaxID=3045146 RepID=UPI0024AE7BFE|nr:recombinase family protein [Petroclostridium sp. X23]WHH59853.1 recombinase family protein [Petroclostridium sp. X23]